MAFRFYEIIQEFMGIKVGGIREEEKENFQKILLPYVLSRRGNLGIPEPKRSIYNYVLTDAQERIYNEMNATGVANHEGQQVEALLQISQAIRLLQIAVSPHLIFPGYTGPSKLDVIPSLVKGKTVIFSRFAEMIKLLDSCVMLIGNMSEKKRQESLNAFKKGDAQVLGLTYGVGGEGLNLAEASRIIMLDLPWNPSGVDQAIGRVVRHGQTKEVDVILIYAGDTLEKHVWDIIQEKKRVTIKEILRRKED